MNRIKRVLVLLISIVFCSVPVLAAPYINIKITYDGKTHTYNEERVYLYVDSKHISNLPMEPIILNNYTLVPAREVFENIGAEVKWYKDTEEIEVIYNGDNLKMKINSDMATVNGEPIKMQVPAKLINSKTMIPVRFVSEAMGLTVGWNNDTRIININIPAPIPEPETEPTTEPETEPTPEPETVPTTLNNIASISLPDSDERTFAINTDKKIERFEKITLEDGSVAIDIYNSKNNIADNNILSVTEFVSNVKIQNIENNVTRFVFTMKKETVNNNFLSEDGKVLYVNFGGNPIKKLDAYSEGDSDILKVSTEYKPEVDVVKSGDEITVEIKNASISNLSEKIEDTNFIDTVKYNSIADNTISIEMTLKKDAKFTNTITDTGFILKLTGVDSEEDSEDIVVSDDRKFTIAKNPSTSVNINSIKHTDNYLNNEYILTFDKDVSSILEPSTYTMESDLVENIEVKLNGEKTEVIITSKQIIAVNVTEDSSNIYINILLPQEKYKDIIVIDPGHGGSAPGTTGNDILEKDMNLDIALRVQKLFEQNSNVKVYFTRLTDVNPSFDDRTDMSNEVADLFVSIHHNAAENASANGTETFYLNPNTQDRGLTSKDVADIMQNHLLEQLDTLDRKVKTSNLIVLRNNKKPAVLVEIGFLSNSAEALKIADPAFRQKAAQGIYDASIEIIEKYPSVR